MTKTPAVGIHQARIMLTEARHRHLATLDDYRRVLAVWIEAADASAAMTVEEFTSGIVCSANAHRRIIVEAARARLALSEASDSLDTASLAETACAHAWTTAVAGLALPGDEAVIAPPEDMP